MLSPKISTSAAKYVEALDATTRKRIRERIAELCKDPYDGRSKPLSGTDKWSARVGSYRILFLVLKDDGVLLVSAVGPRNQVYREI